MTQKRNTSRSQSRRSAQDPEPRRGSVAIPAILTLAGAAVALWLVENQTGAVSRTARSAKGAAEDFLDHAGERARGIYEGASDRMEGFSREARLWGEKARRRGGEAAGDWGESFSHGLANAGAKAAGLAAMLKGLGAGAWESDRGREGRLRMRRAYESLRGQPHADEKWGATEFVMIGLAAAGLGAAAAYLFNPSSGPEHRRMISRQARKVKEQAGEWATAAAEGARHLKESAQEKIGGRFGPDQEGGQDLIRRVREKISEILGGSQDELDVSSSEGRVKIRGHLAADRREQVLLAVRGIEGVSDVEHATAPTQM